jgi:hypothetical protein
MDNLEEVWNEINKASWIIVVDSKAMKINADKNIVNSPCIQVIKKTIMCKWVLNSDIYKLCYW